MVQTIAPTIFNDFIPRGLFYDLTDGVDNENFDEVEGFTINDIYQMLNPNMNSIQDFRDDWEDDYPNANNNALFLEYNVN